MVQELWHKTQMRRKSCGPYTASLLSSLRQYLLSAFWYQNCKNCKVLLLIRILIWLKYSWKLLICHVHISIKMHNLNFSSVYGVNLNALVQISFSSEYFWLHVYLGLHVFRLWGNFRPCLFKGGNYLRKNGTYLKTFEINPYVKN